MFSLKQHLSMKPSNSNYFKFKQKMRQPLKPLTKKQKKKGGDGKRHAMMQKSSYRTTFW